LSNGTLSSFSSSAMIEPYPLAMCRASSDWIESATLAIALSPLATATWGVATSRMFVNAVSITMLRSMMTSTRCGTRSSRWRYANYYAKHWCDPSGFDIGQRGLYQHPAGLVSIGEFQHFNTGDPLVDRPKPPRQAVPHVPAASDRGEQQEPGGRWVTHASPVSRTPSAPGMTKVSG